MRMGLLSIPKRFRLRAAAAEYLEKLGTDDALFILSDNRRLAMFCNDCLTVMHNERGGPLADAFAKLLESFIEDPDKWLEVISTLIALFSA